MDGAHGHPVLRAEPGPFQASGDPAAPPTAKKYFPPPVRGARILFRQENIYAFRAPRPQCLFQRRKQGMRDEKSRTNPNMRR
jgi:hypothetical protein